MANPSNPPLCPTFSSNEDTLNKSLHNYLIYPQNCANSLSVVFVQIQMNSA